MPRDFDPDHDVPWLRGGRGRGQGQQPRNKRHGQDDRPPLVPAPETSFADKLRHQYRGGRPDAYLDWKAIAAHHCGEAFSFAAKVLTVVAVVVFVIHFCPWYTILGLLGTVVAVGSVYMWLSQRRKQARLESYYRQPHWTPGPQRMPRAVKYYDDGGSSFQMPGQEGKGRSNVRVEEME